MSFDPHAFGKSAAVDNFGGYAAAGMAIRSGLAAARQAADIEATAMTVEQWHASFNVVLKLLTAHMQANVSLRDRVSSLMATIEELEAELQGALALSRAGRR